MKTYRVFFDGQFQDVKAKRAEWWGSAQPGSPEGLRLYGNGDKVVASICPGRATGYVVLEDSK